MAAIILGVAPASAARMAGCGGESFAKVEAMVEAMADGSGKFMAQKVVAQAQDAMLTGKMGACSAHLSKAMHSGATNQAAQ